MLHTIRQLKKSSSFDFYKETLHNTQLGYKILLCDNSSVILRANNPEFHARTKYINTYVYAIWQTAKIEQVFLKWIPDKEQVADRLTKLIDYILFQRFINKVKM